MTGRVEWSELQLPAQISRKAIFVDIFLKIVATPAVVWSCVGGIRADEASFTRKRRDHLIQYVHLCSRHEIRSLTIR